VHGTISNYFEMERKLLHGTIPYFAHLNLCIAMKETSEIKKRRRVSVSELLIIVLIIIVAGLLFIALVI
jgi:hypothetical protein